MKPNKKAASLFFALALGLGTLAGCGNSSAEEEEFSLQEVTEPTESEHQDEESAEEISPAFVLGEQSDETAPVYIRNMLATPIKGIAWRTGSTGEFTAVAFPENKILGNGQALLWNAPKPQDAKLNPTIVLQVTLNNGDKVELSNFPIDNVKGAVTIRVKDDIYYVSYNSTKQNKTVDTLALEKAKAGRAEKERKAKEKEEEESKAAASKPAASNSNTRRPASSGSNGANNSGTTTQPVVPNQPVTPEEPEKPGEDEPGTDQPGGDDTNTDKPGGDNNGGNTTTPGGDNPGGSTTTPGGDNPGGSTTTPGGDSSNGGSAGDSGSMGNPGSVAPEPSEPTVPAGNDGDIGGTTVQAGTETPGDTGTSGE